ncbi:PAS domain-containing protein [Deinococcus sp. QL22]|uniref:PAS domain-containing protein n=1 Tax=Deinococcus sp. QL22 TaxID=2939437 RepID=UPI002017ED00|nr:PAS domain-containing protein [Deinococcus sp. QL22]UQN09572.1 PAS domain-containing protein [Deinococcus sp. QL22]
MFPLPSSEVRSLTDAFPQLWCTTDLQGRTLWGNRAWHAHTSLVMGTDLADLVLPDDQNRVKALFASAQESFCLDLPLRDAAGQAHWFRLSGQRQAAAQDRPATWVVTGVNIHDLKEDQHQRTVLQDLVDASPNCIKVLSLDARLLSMNEGGKRPWKLTISTCAGNCCGPRSGQERPAHK